MRNVRVLPYKAGSQSASRLASELGCLRISLTSSSIMLRRSPVQIINWGNSGRNLPPQGLGTQHTIINPLDAVRTAGNKLFAFGEMDRAGTVRIPEYTTSREEAAEWMAEDPRLKIVERHALTGNSGEGIRIVESAEDLSLAPLYVRYIPKQDEYRVHIMQGEVIDVQRKARTTSVPDEDVNWQVRNMAGGFIFMRGNITPPQDVIQQARSAVAALGLDFGAVDVIWNEHRQEAYVLEVNTAPGLTGTTLQRYSVAFRELLTSGDVTPLEGYEQEEVEEEADDTSYTLSSGPSEGDTDMPNPTPQVTPQDEVQARTGALPDENSWEPMRGSFAYPDTFQVMATQVDGEVIVPGEIMTATRDHRFFRLTGGSRMRQGVYRRINQLVVRGYSVPASVHNPQPRTVQITNWDDIRPGDLLHVIDAGAVDPRVVDGDTLEVVRVGMTTGRGIPTVNTRGGGRESMWWWYPNDLLRGNIRITRTVVGNNSELSGESVVQPNTGGILRYAVTVGGTEERRFDTREEAQGFVESPEMYNIATLMSIPVRIEEVRV